MQLWGGGARGGSSSEKISAAKKGGAGGYVAFELEIDLMAYGRYEFTIGGPKEDSVAT